MNILYIYILVAIGLIIAISFLLYSMMTRESLIIPAPATSAGITYGMPYTNVPYAGYPGNSQPTFSPKTGDSSGLLIDPSGNLQITAPVPIGTIVMWANANIPTGWSVCDGTKGTPDLRSRFIVGAALPSPNQTTSNTASNTLFNYSINDIGGEEYHTLALSEMPSHTHITNYGTFNDSGGVYGTGKWSIIPGSTSSTGGDQNNDTVPHNNLPPFYALYFIMKMS